VHGTQCLVQAYKDGKSSLIIAETCNGSGLQLQLIPHLNVGMIRVCVANVQDLEGVSMAQTLGGFLRGAGQHVLITVVGRASGAMFTVSGFKALIYPFLPLDPTELSRYRGVGGIRVNTESVAACIECKEGLGALVTSKALHNVVEIHT
jgi:hypothetical protein